MFINDAAEEVRDRVYVCFHLHLLFLLLLERLHVRLNLSLFCLFGCLLLGQSLLSSSFLLLGSVIISLIDGLNSGFGVLDSVLGLLCSLGILYGVHLLDLIIKLLGFFDH